MANVTGSSPTISANSRKIKTPSATVSRPGSSTPIVITSFAMKDCASEFDVPDSIQMLTPLEFEVILEELKKRDAIKYAAYRTASKFEKLRTALNLDQVKLGAVTSAFNQHGFKTALTDAKFNASKATDVIADIFFSAGKVNCCFLMFMYTPAKSLQIFTLEGNVHSVCFMSNGILTSVNSLLFQEY